MSFKISIATNRICASNLAMRKLLAWVPESFFTEVGVKKTSIFSNGLD